MSATQGTMQSTTRRFREGEVLFRQGDVSDHVLQIRSGEIEILREVGAASVLLGHVRKGEWLGEMGVVENRPRSATARAASEGEAEILTAAEFVDRVSRDAALARELIVRLSVRLRRIEDKIALELMSFGQSRPDAAPENALAENARIALAAGSEALRARLGAAPLVVGKLPFLVGRAAAAEEEKPLHQPDLVIDDRAPFRLSRQHFMIARSAGQLLVSDLGSTLGTIINGQPIGHHFPKDAAPLHRGDNRIVAGGADSPFAFAVSVA